MEQQKIVKVIRTVREGVSKKTSKPYSILLVLTEKGDEVEVFGPAQTGDMVGEVTYNEKFDQLQGRVMKPDKNEDVMAGLQKIYSEVVSIRKGLALALGSDVPKAAAPRTAAPAKTSVETLKAQAKTWASNPPSRGPAKAQTMEPNPFMDEDESPPPDDVDYPADLMEGSDDDRL